MRSQFFKLHMYIVVISFTLLWILSIRVLVQSPQNQPASGYEQETLVTATILYMETEDPRVTRVGEIAWGIVFLGLAGGAVYAGLTFKDALYAKRKRFPGNALSYRSRTTIKHHHDLLIREIKAPVQSYSNTYISGAQRRKNSR